MLPVRCLSAEKKKAYPFICTINILSTKGFLKCLKCLLFMLLLLHSAAADFCRKAAPYALLVSHLRQKCYGVTSGNSPFVNLRSAHLFLRFYIVCMSELIRTILAPLSARSSTRQATSADIQAWCLKTACLRTDEGNIQKIHKIHSFHISISSHRVSCSVFFISVNLFSVIRQFDDCCYLS